MKKEETLKKMLESIGTKDPIEFFAEMVNVFSILFDRIDKLESTLKVIKTQSALSIQWEPKVASDMLAKQVNILREDKESYSAEISALKKAFAEDMVTQTYTGFCEFWEDTLGWHPFLD
jgi:hypothetical protein